MILRPIYMSIVVTGFLLALALSGAFMLYSEWRAGYVILYQSVFPQNMIRNYLDSFLERIYRPLLASRKPGLPMVRLYVSQRDQEALMKDAPSSIKKWRQAYMLYPDGKQRRIQVRHRGDNPANWAYEKKAWRIKTRKQRLIDRVRKFNYFVPREPNLLENYLGYRIGQSAGVLTPKTRMVEMSINERPYGIYLEVEHIDENFLRNNRRMPVNVYKGEQDNAERRLMIDTDLFNNPALWTKTAAFNQLPENDFTDLSIFLDLIRRAETSQEAFGKLKLMAPFSEWARFSAFQTLVQSWHNDSSHNQRLLSDPWKGTVTPIVHDTSSSFMFDNETPPVLDSAKHDLLALYMKSSAFLLEKYRILAEFVDRGILRESARHIETLLPGLERSLSRDSYRYQHLYTNNLERDYATDARMKAEWDLQLKNMAFLHDWLKDRLTAPPKAHWNVEDGDFLLIVDGTVPVGDVAISLAPEARRPGTVAWDRDGDGRLSKGDVPIPVRGSDDGIVLDAVWLANRIMISSFPPLDGFNGGDVSVTPTQFRLVSETSIAPLSVRASNPLTGRKAPLARSEENGNTPSLWNRPVMEDAPRAAEVWSGELTVEGIRVLDTPVRILPGTHIRMKPGASLVFRRRVMIEGTPEKEVTIGPAIPGGQWGVVALQGQGASGSTISGLAVEGGSGGAVGSVRYTAMLSIHQADDVVIDGLTLRRNRNFDDMMHVVYSSGVVLRGCLFEDAFADGLDIDNSNMRISDCRISRSANDAIDLMSSDVLIENAELLESGDKGVSIGEDSTVLVYDSRLYRNAIGIESKDGSTAHVIHSDLADNKVQVRANKKNWRYGAGGAVVMDKSIVASQRNNLSADKHSRIEIFDTTLDPMPDGKDRQISIDPSSGASGGRRASAPTYQASSAEALRRWNIGEHAGSRGTIR